MLIMVSYLITFTSASVFELVCLNFSQAKFYCFDSSQRTKRQTVSLMHLQQIEEFRTHCVLAGPVNTRAGNLQNKIHLTTCQRQQEGDLIKEYEFFMRSSENKRHKQVIWVKHKKEIPYLKHFITENSKYIFMVLNLYPAFMPAAF